MKKTLITVLAVLWTCMAIANTGLSKTGRTKTGRTISGTLKDNKGEALSFANIFLHKAADSTFVKAVAADTDGKFNFEDIQDNKYFLKVSFVGFVDLFTPTFTINAENPNMVFPELKLQEVGKELQAVTVTAKKPFIEQHIDKTVINVENSIVSSGSTALEVLEKAPGVIVDRQNDQIKLRNKTGVLVMIDGKQNYMSAEALAQYLNNMTSDQIETIEIITNPSSKYEAAGNSGIINIKLKKNKNYGTNGTYSASVGSGVMPNSHKDLYRGSTNLSLNHRNAKWNFFGNGNVGRSRNYNSNNITRKVNYENSLSEFDQFSQRIGGGVFYSLRGGADYFLNDKTTLGVMGDLNNWEGKMNSTGRTNIAEIYGAERISSYLLPESSREMGNTNFSANFNLKHKFNTKGKEVGFDIDYNGYRSAADQNFENSYYNNVNTLDSVSYQRMHQPTDINIISGKLDFVIPMENKVKLEFGAKTGYVSTDNNFKFENRINNVWISDLQKTNHFKYNEWINAAYVNAGYKWGKWAFQGGLRLEHTSSEGNSITLKEINSRNYLNLFPTFFVNQTINENNSIRYSYSKRVDRPNYQQLNPFLFFLDPYTFEKGNPALKPQFTDSYDVTYTFKNTYSVSLAFADTKDMIFEVLEQNDATKETYQSNQNIARMQNYSANFSLPFTITKWWSMHNSVNLFYNRFKDGNLAGASLNDGRFAYNIYSGNTFTLPNSWSAEATVWYNSPIVYGIIRMAKPQYAINAGVQKSFWNKKARLKLNVNDIFLTSLFAGNIKYSNMDTQLQSRWTARRVTLTFTYNFGNQNVRSSRKSTAGEDLKKRIGGGEG